MISTRVVLECWGKVNGTFLEFTKRLTCSLKWHNSYKAWCNLSFCNHQVIKSQGLLIPTPERNFFPFHTKVAQKKECLQCNDTLTMYTSLLRSDDQALCIVLCRGVPLFESLSVKLAAFMLLLGICMEVLPQL